MNKVMYPLEKQNPKETARLEKLLEQAKEDAKRATRNYAKRQMTWFRNQNEKANYIFAQYSERNLDKIISKIRF